MTKEEILKKAKRDYPIGTIHSGYDGTGSYLIANHDFYVSLGGYLYCKNKSGCIYSTKNNYWAKIISKPINKYELW
jgi:hypothetical protein